MGGGEGSTAREILRHKTVEKVVMCDIDEVKFPISHFLFLFYFIRLYNVNDLFIPKKNQKVNYTTITDTIQAFKHISLEQEVVEFCKSYLVVNKEAFSDPRLELVINDARFYLIFT